MNRYDLHDKAKLLHPGQLQRTRRDNFPASLMLRWAAMSIINVASYIRDAFGPKTMLLGGKTGAESDGHDWQSILGDLGLIGGRV